jgi:uncharacterized protein YbaR (Trm112 family)
VFIELIDQLRCINAHEDTWLVASFKTVSNRFVLEGSLGCPSCSAQYPIGEGIADFSAGLALRSCEAERAAASHNREEHATRAGAYLDATEPGATIVLGGIWAYAAEELSQMAEVRVLALNAPAGVKESERVGLVHVGSEIPVAPGSVLGVAFDAWFPAKLIASAIRAVRPGGRIVGPVTIPAPAELSVLAHDENYWVAQKAPEVVKLSRASR